MPTRFILQRPLTPNQITLMELGDWASPEVVIFCAMVGACFLILSVTLGTHMFLCWLGHVVTRFFRSKPKKTRVVASSPSTSEPDLVRSLAPVVAASQWAALQQIEQFRQMVLTNPSAGAPSFPPADSFYQEPARLETPLSGNQASFLTPISQVSPASPLASYGAPPAPPALQRPVTRSRTHWDCK